MTNVRVEGGKGDECEGGEKGEGTRRELGGEVSVGGWRKVWRGGCGGGSKQERPSFSTSGPSR